MDGVSVSSLITGFASGVISSVLTYFSTRSKIRLDMKVEYDKSLHEKRLALYKELWPRTEPLGRYKPHFVLTHKIVSEVAANMHNWYFGEGGIYLSKRSRKPKSGGRLDRTSRSGIGSPLGSSSISGGAPCTCPRLASVACGVVDISCT